MVETDWNNGCLWSSLGGIWLERDMRNLFLDDGHVQYLDRVLYYRDVCVCQSATYGRYRTQILCQKKKTIIKYLVQFYKYV